MYSTTPTFLEKLANLIKINQRFHKYQKDKINQDSSIFISPVQAKLIYQGRINKNNALISKFNKQINLQKTLGEKGDLFSNGFYMTFYLSPKDKHYWRIPYNSKPISTKVNNGKSKMPIITGLENFFPKTDFFEKSIKNNATIGTIYQTTDFPYAMIVVGSLNVNSIHTIKKDYFKKGEIAGYFNLGSSMLLCFPEQNIKNLRVLIDEGDKVNIGEGIIKIKVSK